MVALSEDFEIPTETALRVRAQSHTYRSGAAHCSNPRRQSNLRRRIYDGGDQSESCSRDPIGIDSKHFSSYGIRNGRALTFLDPSGLEFVHPGDIGSIDACEQWRSERLNDCWMLTGKAQSDCVTAVNRAADNCVDRNADDSLKDQLDSACCAGLSEMSDRLACQADAKRMVKAMARARDKIYGNGGPTRFGKKGHCTTCQSHVEGFIPLSPFFKYEMKSRSAGFPFGIPGVDHCWGELSCAKSVRHDIGDDGMPLPPTGEDFEPVATIDFWAGGRDYWRPGSNGYGWVPGNNVFWNSIKSKNCCPDMSVLNPVGP